MPQTGLQRKKTPDFDIKSKPLVLVGKPEELNKVKNAIKKLKIVLEEVHWEDFDIKKLKKDFKGLLLIDFALSPLLESTLTDIRQSIHPSYPVFAVVSDKISDLKVRNIYEQGATAVFEWPLESFILPILLSELLGMEMVRGKAAKADTSLKRSARAHLRMMKDLPKDIKISVTKGLVSVSGNVSSLPKKTRIEEILSMIPGVTGVNVQSLIVSPSGHSDKTISQKIKKAIRITRFIDESTLAYEIQNGYVVLAGSVAGATEFKNLINVISEIEGVRGIKNLTTLSPSEKKKDHIHSRVLKKFLKLIYPKEKISAKYFGGVAVLTGKVKSLAIKKRIQKDVEGQNFVERVVNKIHVK